MNQLSFKGLNDSSVWWHFGKTHHLQFTCLAKGHMVMVSEHSRTGFSDKLLVAQKNKHNFPHGPSFSRGTVYSWEESQEELIHRIKNFQSQREPGSSLVNPMSWIPILLPGLLHGEKEALPLGTLLYGMLSEPFLTTFAILYFLGKMRYICVTIYIGCTCIQVYVCTCLCCIIHLENFAIEVKGKPPQKLILDMKYFILHIKNIWKFSFLHEHQHEME